MLKLSNGKSINHIKMYKTNLNLNFSYNSLGDHLYKIIIKAKAKNLK